MHENLDNTLTEFVTALKDADSDEHFMGKKGCALHAAGHGKGVYLGEQIILSSSFKYALTEKLQQNFIATDPDKISELYREIYVDICMNSIPSDNILWPIQNRIIFDPEAKYSALSANSALLYKKQDKNLEERFWSNFLDFMPTKEQLNTNKSKVSKSLKQTYMWDDYQVVSKYNDENIILPTDWHEQVKILYPDFEATKNEELDRLKTSSYSGEDNQIENSRKILISSPEESLGLLVGTNPRSDKKFLQDYTIPVLCARAEFLSEMKGNFAYAADHYFYKASYYQGSCFAGEEQKQEITLHIQQNRVNMGERFIDMDVAALKKQTKLLKSQPR